MEAVAVAAELRSADEVAIAAIGLEALVSKAGYALALGVRRTAGRCVGLRVVVLAGPGLNGADGRAAAKVLRKFGATVSVVEVGTPVLPACDVVVDAAFGTGCSRPFAPPQLTGTPLVVAADLPSGLDATTGVVHGRALKADRTVTFGALKPGLLYQQGRALAGSIEVATLDLVLTTAVEQVTNDDLAALPPLSEERHKWTVAVGVVAGSSGMYGAPSLVASAALRTGAGMVCVATSAPELSLAREAVLSPLPAGAWSVLAETTFARCGALVLAIKISTPSSRVSCLRVIRPSCSMQMPCTSSGQSMTSRRFFPDVHQQHRWSSCRMMVSTPRSSVPPQGVTGCKLLGCLLKRLGRRCS